MTSGSILALTMGADVSAIYIPGFRFGSDIVFLQYVNQSFFFSNICFETPWLYQMNRHTSV